jgi:2-(1,2-epoxy-1,2-dihydrophenyl)acetyl-CoA isomerase
MEEIIVNKAGGVCVITLNRPERLNALVATMMATLVDAVADAARDPSVGCVVVTGAGRGFCAGGDIKDGADAQRVEISFERGGRIEQGAAQLRGFMETSRLLHDMEKPTIAMVNGPVAGAGIGIAGACDLRFAAQSATFLSAFDRIGGSGDFGSTYFWTKILGSGAAREMFLLGEKLSATDALAKGIFTRVFPDDELRDATMTVAQRMANGPRMAWRYIKDNLNRAENHALEEAFAAEALNMTLSTTASATIWKAARRAKVDEI